MVGASLAQTDDRPLLVASAFHRSIAVYLAVVEMGCSGSHIPASEEGLTALLMWPNLMK
jgi:hypothetical protein